MNILFPTRMKDLTIIVHDNYIDDVIDALHTIGDVQISSIDKDSAVRDLVDIASTHKSLSDCTEYEMKLNSVQDVFDGMKDEEECIWDMLFPKDITQVKRKKKNFDDLLQEIDDRVETEGKRIISLNDELNFKEEKLSEMEALRKDILEVSKLDMELSYLGERHYTVYRAGKTSKPAVVKRALSELETSHLVLQPLGEGEYIAIAGAYIRDRKKLDLILRETDVEILDLDRVKGTPTQALKALNTKIKGLKEEVRDLRSSLSELKQEHQMEFLVLQEELHIVRDKLEIYQGFGKTHTTSVIKGWTTEDRVQRVDEAVKKYTDGCGFLIAEEPEDPYETPVSLNNPNILRPFELLTRMFAPPRYDEVDPTFVIAPAFVIFFGLMLGDAVYGLLIVAVSLVLYYGIGRIEEGTRDFSLILLSAGISTFIFGILQGGYLGPNRDEYLNLLGRFGFEPPLLLDTLEGDGPLTLLIISLLIGLAYINLGLVLSLVQNVRRKNYRNVVLENVSWWLLQPGGFILLSGKLFGWYDFTGTVYLFAGVITVIGLILLVIRAKGLSFFEITGFLGDFLSFARILALGLATAGIALTVNVLAYLVADASMDITMTSVIVGLGGLLLLRWLMVKDKKMLGGGAALVVIGGLGFIDPMYPFFILSLVVLVGGHIVNASLQALGSFVHSLRLQYVEFFGYFYEGGGKEFEPFKPERQYTLLEEGRK
ncbi:MAG: V-type ATP synthase subunit I [Thermoplasmata archaeon]